MNEHKYEIGDKVRLVGDKLTGTLRPYKGQIAEIVDGYDADDAANDDRHIVEVNGIRGWVLVSDGDIEPVDTFTEGDRVLVWSDNEANAVKRTFLMTDKNGQHICVAGGHGAKYEEGFKYLTVVWKYIKAIPAKNTDLEEALAAYADLGEKIAKLKEDK